MVFNKTVEKFYKRFTFLIARRTQLALKLLRATGITRFTASAAIVFLLEQKFLQTFSLCYHARLPAEVSQTT